MVSLLQLTFIRPAVTPEHICICRDEITPGQPIKPICLQVLIPVVHPGTGLVLGDAVPLDEEEFGLASQHGARISREKKSDVVQTQACAARVCAQEMILRSTANDAADKAITFEVLPLSDYQFESWNSVFHTQPLVEEHLEVKGLKCLFQHVWVSKERSESELKF